MDGSFMVRTGYNNLRPQNPEGDEQWSGYSYNDFETRWPPNMFK